MSYSNEDRREGGDACTRFEVNWDLVAGHRELRTVRGHVSNVSTSGVLIHVPVHYAIGSFVEIEMSPAVGVFIRAVVQIIREHAKSAEVVQYGSKIVGQSTEHRVLMGGILLDMRRKQMQSDFGRVPQVARKPGS